MIIFILLAFVLLLLALMILLPGFFSRGQSEVDLHGAGEERRRLNIALLRDRLNELDGERVSGLLTEEQHAKATEELQRDLLVNAEVSQSNTPTGADGRWLGWVVAVLLPLCCIGLYLKLGATELLVLPPEAKAAQVTPESTVPRSSTTSAAPTGQGGSGASAQGEGDMGDMASLTDRLAARLENEPENAEGWLLLARSFSMQERYPEAMRAYRRSLSVTGDVAGVLAELAEATLLTSADGVSAEADSLIQRALALDPKEARALWLSGVSSARRGDKEGAVAQWQRLLEVLEPGDRMRTLVEQRIAELSGKPSGWEVMAEPEAEPAQQAPQPVQPAGIPIQIDVDGALVGSYNPAHTLFIFARAPGQRMPIAIQRHAASALPLKATLSDNDVMVAGQSLASYAELEIVARISQSGSAMVQAGDLEGVTRLDLSRASGLVEVHIDTRR